MRKEFFLAIFLFLFVVRAAGQDMRQNIGRSLFTDQKASQIGDAVTILVIETSTASNDASTSSSKSSDISGSTSGTANSKALPEFGIKLGTGNSFKGEGSTSSRGTLRAKISARVDSMLANGNLVVRGSRRIKINGEEQIINISGIVRPTDILPDNSVYSFNVSDAVIVFEGDGIVSRAQGPGWITKLLHWLF
jgi:flagellar L-ring protein precursor FlgH